MNEMIAAGALFLIALTAFVLSILSFRETGFLLNNAYLWASSADRDKMDKKPHYRQSAIVFAMLGCVFLLFGASLLTGEGWMRVLAYACIAAVSVYAVISAAAIQAADK